ncbi:SAV_915 family protein [Nonomuraea sp. NPDC046802]|uniref:SAV_915 family protein n=1 Tax=Nonomuraea sp. NPDC046802 TaxID=3154919 RepID=UPI003401D28F
MSEPPLFVPVRERAGALSLRLFRTAAGARTAVAFTSPLRVAAVLGAGQQWVRLSEPALRSLIAGLDVAGILLDPADTPPHAKVA